MATLVLLQIGLFLCMSPDVVGATLLAFGNGAPDYFTNLRFIDNDEVDLTMAIAFVLGADNFVIMVVIPIGETS